jgi:hypothetical protein
VPADVLAHAERRARGVEETGRVEPARRSECGLFRAKPVRQGCNEAKPNAQVAFDRRSGNRDSFERTLAAHAA